MTYCSRQGPECIRDHGTGLQQAPAVRANHAAENDVKKRVAERRGLLTLWTTK